MTRQPPPPATRTSSLRLRVVLGVLALLLVVLVGLGFVVNAVVGDRLRSDLRQRLQDRAGLAQVLAQQGLTGQQLLDRVTGQGVLATQRTSSGVLTGVENPTPPRPGRGGPGKPPAPSATVAVQQQGETLSSTVEVGNGQQVTLSANLTDIDRALATLRSVELAAGGATLVVVGLGLVWVVGAALSPLDRMTALARRIRDGARGGRLHPTNQRTEIGRTALAFDDMLDSLETAEHHARAAEERMRQFLADASHDLRTPVAGMITSAERLLREDPDRAAREAQLLTLIREGRRAARLVDDVVLISRLDGEGEAAQRRRVVDVASLIDGVVARRRDHVAPVVTDGSPGAHVDGDPDRLERMITNLLDNAVRHGGRDAAVEVRTVVDGDRVHVEVCDHGPGVEPADRERIFDRFVRLAEHRSGPGSGLGLPIARAIAAAHDGWLDCTDRSDGRPGARFHVSLPLHRRVVDVSPQVVAASSASNNADSSRSMSPA